MSLPPPPPSLGCLHSALGFCCVFSFLSEPVIVLSQPALLHLFLLVFLRCQGAEAFEIQHSGLANGIFMKFLKDRLLEDKKITVLLDEVAEGNMFKGQSTQKSPAGERNPLWVPQLVVILFLPVPCGFGISACFSKEFWLNAHQYRCYLVLLFPCCRG